MLLGLAVTCLCFRIWHWDGKWHFKQSLCLHSLLVAWIPFCWRLMRRVEVDWIQRHIMTNDFVEGLSRSMTIVSQVAIIFGVYWFTPLKGDDPASEKRNVQIC